MTGHCLQRRKPGLPSSCMAPGAHSAHSAAGRDGSPDNLPGEETTREKPQDLTTHKQEVRRQHRPALRGARLRDRPGHKGGKLSP